MWGAVRGLCRVRAPPPAGPPSGGRLQGGAEALSVQRKANWRGILVCHGAVPALVRVPLGVECCGASRASPPRWPARHTLRGAASAAAGGSAHAGQAALGGGFRGSSRPA